ncbi:DUF4013 domain-containing protein [Candidatus Woesearchaeota archaeon]|nr:DUF4013 domain-containing protein [Candidatus Woesearchaeota archaeon]
MDIVESIKRPFSDIKKWIIGCLLMIIPIVNLFSLGYILESARLSLGKKRDLPEWDNWGNLFIAGLLNTVIGFIYLLIPGILLVIALGTLLLSMFSGEGFNFGALLAAGPLFILAFVLGLFAIYILPSAILNWVKEDRFGAAFSFGTILKKAFTGKYFVAWIVGAIINVVVVSILSFIPFVGGAIGSFTGMIISYTLLGEAVAEL